MKRKAKGSLRDQLAADYLKNFAADFALNGVAAIEEMRQKSPEKYIEVAARLISATEPPNPDSLSEADSMEDIARWLLRRVGCHEPSDSQLQEAIEANDKFIARLEEIKANANGDADSIGES
jgi:hypothetical protein